MPRSPDQPKRPLTQRQLEVLAKSNPLVAKRMKEGYYKDRLAGTAAAPARKRRAQPAKLPADPGRDPGTARPTPGQTRAKPRANPGATRKKSPPAGRGPGATRKSPRRDPGEAQRPPRSGGFLKGLLGGG